MVHSRKSLFHHISVIFTQENPETVCEGRWKQNAPGIMSIGKNRWEEIETMKIAGSITGTNNQMQTGAGMNMQTDSVSKNIQNQIANAQKALQELSSSEALTPEEKMKRRQEIQQEITNLNQQLRQHQIELRKEQQAKNELASSRNEKTAKPGKKGSGMSQAGMQAVIAADSSMKQALKQGSVAVSMEGRAGVLESEIKTDRARGADTAWKEAELSDVKQSAENAGASQMNALASANQALEEAAETEQEGRTDETGRTDKKDKSRENKAGKTDSAENVADVPEAENTAADKESIQPVGVHVDVRL